MCQQFNHFTNSELKQMKKITSITELRENILLLEIKQANEKILLKEQFKTTYEGLKPVNLIKNTFNELIAAPYLKEGLFDTILSLAAGYLSKKAVVGSTNNPLKQILGTFLQMGITNIVSKNADEIKSSVMNLINTIFSKKDASA